MKTYEQICEAFHETYHQQPQAAPALFVDFVTCLVTFAMVPEALADEALSKAELASEPPVRKVRARIKKTPKSEPPPPPPPAAA